MAMVANFSDEFVARKATYMGVGNTLLLGLPGHTRGHFDDMRQLIAAARAQ